MMTKKFADNQLCFIALVIAVSLPVSILGGLALAFFSGIASIAAVLSIRRIKFHILLTKHFFLTSGFSILLLWSLTSLGWTLNEKAAGAVLLRLSLLFLGGAYLLVYSVNPIDAEKQFKIGKIFSIFFILAAFLFLFEVYSGGVFITFIKTKFYHIDGYIPKLSDMNRGAVYLGLFFWVLLAFWENRKTSILAVMAIITIFAVLSSVSLSAKMGLLGGAAAFFFARKWPKGFFIAAVIVLTAALVLFPLVNLYTHPQAMAEQKILPISSVHRMFIWQFVTHEFLNKPWVGWGFDSSPYIPGGSDLVLDGKYNTDWRYLPLHPHNNILQMLLELGIGGGVLLVLIFSFILNDIRKSALSQNQKAAFSALAINYFIVGMTAFGIWQFWWIGAFVLASSAFLLISAKPVYNLDSSVAS